MDKEQATDHILTRLRAGNQAEEIAEELSRLLKAPIDKIRPFVDQVADSQPEAVAQPQVGSLGDMEPQEVYPQPDQPAAPQNEFSAGISDLPPGLQALINDVETPGMMTARPTPVSEPRKPPEAALPRQAEFVAPAQSAESTNIDLENLGESVLNQLKKQRRHNDIVESVCKETGWHWNKSQRFVARVQTKHHDEIHSGKNRVTMIVGVGIILVGLVMTLNGVSVISDYAKLAAFAKTNPEVLLNVEPSTIFFALSATVTGIVMILGGGYGIARSQTNR